MQFTRLRIGLRDSLVFRPTQAGAQGGKGCKAALVKGPDARSDAAGFTRVVSERRPRQWKWKIGMALNNNL